MTGDPIADVADVPDDSTLLFTIRPAEGDGGGGANDADGADDRREAFLVRIDDPGDSDDRDDRSGSSPVAAWVNECQHFTHVRLDKGSGAPRRGSEVVCANHGAMFRVDTGECTFGPCEGAVLPAVEVTVADGTVYLDDPAYELVGLGGTDDGDDLTSRSNVEF